MFNYGSLSWTSGVFSNGDQRGLGGTPAGVSILSRQRGGSKIEVGDAYEK